MSKPIDPEVLEQIEAVRRSMPPEEYTRRLEGARKSVLAEVEAFMPAFEELGVKVVCVDSFADCSNG